MTPAPGATTIVPSSPASRPSPPGGLRPALTPTAGAPSERHLSGGEMGGTTIVLIYHQDRYGVPT